MLSMVAVACGGSTEEGVEEVAVEDEHDHESTLEQVQERGFLKCGVSTCLLYTSPSPRDKRQSRMPSSA